MNAPASSPLTEAILHTAVAELALRDGDLARIVAQHGPPPLWARAPGFPTLVLMILEQQVSLASARAAFNRLEAVVGQITPTAVLALSDETLRNVGFSRQKAGYARALAAKMEAGEFDPDHLATLDDDGVRQALTALKGIGP